jgi:UrcA family protein
MRKLLILASCVLVAFTIESQARESFKNRTVAVDYADLDLSSAADQQILRERVDRAVKKACSSPYDSGMVLGTNTDRRRCIIWTREQAMASISNTAQLASRPTAIRADRQYAEVAVPNKTVDDSRTQRAVRLSWRNVDLAQESNLRTLKARIDQSAETVCDSPADIRAGVAGSRDRQRCLSEAKGTAYASIPNGTSRFAALDNQPVATQTAAETPTIWDWFVTILK